MLEAGAGSGGERRGRETRRSLSGQRGPDCFLPRTCDDLTTPVPQESGPGAAPSVTPLARPSPDRQGELGSQHNVSSCTGSSCEHGTFPERSEEAQPAAARPPAGPAPVPGSLPSGQRLSQGCWAIAACGSAGAESPLAAAAVPPRSHEPFPGCRCWWPSDLQGTLGFQPPHLANRPPWTARLLGAFTPLSVRTF